MAKSTIGRRGSAVGARNVFKNPGAKEITANLTLPLIARDSPIPSAANLFPDFQATWYGAPVTWSEKASQSRSEVSMLLPSLAR